MESQEIAAPVSSDLTGAAALGAAGMASRTLASDDGAASGRTRPH